MASSLWLGLMTGSSVDGCDMVAMAKVAEQYHCLAAHHVPMPASLRASIMQLLEPEANELHHALIVNQQLAQWLGEQVLMFLKTHGWSSEDVAAIGLHGQTIRHQPNLALGYTQQLGCPSRLAALLNCPVVADFRSADVAVGGQGAPLAPLFHQAFFAAPHRAVLNVGGIANLTLFGELLQGFDTGPGNALLDAWIEQQQQQPFDIDGQWARSGQVNAQLLQTMLADPFFHKTGPKTTGRDYFNLTWLMSILQGSSESAANVQATLLALTVQSIVAAVHAAPYSICELVVCGGGVYNTELMHQLAEALQPIAVKSSSHLGLAPQWVEAMGFAWLAAQRLALQPLPTPSITGAKRPVLLGGVYRV